MRLLHPRSGGANDLCPFWKTKTSIKENLKHVMSEVMGKSVVFEKKKTNISEEVEINGSKVYIAIKLHKKNG